MFREDALTLPFMHVTGSGEEISGLEFTSLSSFKCVYLGHSWGLWKNFWNMSENYFQIKGWKREPIRLKNKTWTVPWASHSSVKTHINIDGFSINVFEQKSLPKGSKPNGFISDHFPCFLQVSITHFHPSWEENWFSRLSLNKHFPFETASETVSVETPVRLLGVFLFVSFCFFLTKIHLTGRDRAHSSGNTFLIVLHMLLFFFREDKWWNAKNILLFATGRVGSSESQPKLIIFQLNWSVFVCLFLICFPGTSPEIFPAPSIFKKYERLSVSYRDGQRPKQGMNGPAMGTVGQWAGAAEVAWSLLPPALKTKRK